jgi:hypothetical protein
MEEEIKMGQSARYWDKKIETMMPIENWRL